MENVRPTFLTVLCILTFLYSGYSIVSSTMVYMDPQKTVYETQQKFEELEDQLDSEDMPSSLSSIFNTANEINTPEIMKKNSMGAIIASILTLLGAIFMWDLKKKGFYIYIAGTVVGIIIPLIVYGSGWLGLAGAVGTGIIGALFIALYSMHLKYMQ